MNPPSPAGLAAQLQAGGHLTDDWLPTFTAVDRAGFLPERIWLRADGGYEPVDRAVDPVRWQAAAYGDTPVVTQVEDPGGAAAMVPSSSASMPRMVAAMLAHLDVHPGQRVLEVGTGTGYNAALLAHRLGDDQVTTIEVDPGLADTARRSLKAAGFAPTVVTGDGAAGWPERAPYDRVVVTAALAGIPPALIAQTRPGGVIVTPWGTGLYNGVLLRLTVHDGPDGRVASGPVVGDSSFMWLRQHAPRRNATDDLDTAGAVTSLTELDPRYVLGDENAAFAVGTLLPTIRYTVGHGDGGEFTLWLTHPDGSWASVDYTPDATVFDLQQNGPRRLWDDIETAYQQWLQQGSPARTRYTATVHADGALRWESGNEPARQD